MNKKSALLLVCALILLFPVYFFFQMEQVAGAQSELFEFQKALRNFQISTWTSWLVLVCIAIYYKWTEKSNFFFTATYVFLLFANILFGIYMQRIVNIFKLPSRFEDHYTLGVFAAIQNILISVILTGFLQGGVWWFTRRWHRR